MQHPSNPHGVIWTRPDGSVVACHEKVLVLNENYGELKQLLQDALDDALLMGCDETQLRAILHSLVDSLRSPIIDASRRAADGHS